MARKQILSPLPGTFYRRPAPEKPPYKQDGDRLAPGEVVGLVEVMKTFYEVKAESAGRIVKFLIGNEDAVQAGQVLAEIED
jgi:biotin carboxyl carrier protein